MKNNIFEIRIHARAQQGANTIAHFLVEAIINARKYAQAFPYYGPERSGSPLIAFVRISDKPIRIYSQVYNPNAAIVVDDTLLKTENISHGIEEKGIILINSHKAKDEIKKTIKGPVDLNIIDANNISQKILGIEMPNTILLGALIKLLEKRNYKFISLDDIIKITYQEFIKKIGKEMTEKNIKAIKAGYSSI